MDLVTLFAGLLDLIFPPSCMVCKKNSHEIICKECLLKVKYYDPPFCKVCGKQHDNKFEGNFCHDCYIKKPAFNLVRSVAVYEGVIKKALHKFKFNNKHILSVPLGKIMLEYLTNNKEINLSEIDLIVPVPLSRKRRRQREYNQAELLAEELSKFTGIELSIDSLLRKRETIPQFKLSREERLTNLKDAFMALPHVNKRSVLLIDDIYTTGSTVKEASIALKQAGAEKVHALTLARAVI